MAESVGDVLGLDSAMVRVRIVVFVDGRVGRRFTRVESGYASQGLGRTDKGVVVGSMANLLSFHSILLVSEFQASVANALDDVRNIQRSCI